jgi:myosin protein heavy chain
MASNQAQKRNNPFSRTGSPSPVPGSTNGRPKSVIMSPPLSVSQSPPHNRHQSYSSLAGIMSPSHTITTRHRSNSKTGTPTSNTFAPSFINSEEMRRGPETIKGIEGENDFSGKRYVWLKDPQTAFVKGWVVEKLGNDQILVQCDDGSVSATVVMEEPLANPVLATRSQRRQRRQGQSSEVRQGR